MLDLRPSCENCRKSLPPESTEAVICSFECTWCTTCNEELLKNVCPNCGGNLVPRPIRPKSKLKKYPATQKETFAPVDEKLFGALRDEMKD